jgi:hypothetical protein
MTWPGLEPEAPLLEAGALAQAVMLNELKCANSILAGKFPRDIWKI